MNKNQWYPICSKKTTCWNPAEIFQVAWWPWRACSTTSTTRSNCETPSMLTPTRLFARLASALGTQPIKITGFPRSRAPFTRFLMCFLFHFCWQKERHLAKKIYDFMRNSHWQKRLGCHLQKHVVAGASRVIHHSKTHVNNYPLVN